MSGNTNVQVLVRCRPKLAHEVDSQCNLLECDANTVRVQHNTCTDKVFSFDKVLDGGADQDDVFEYTSPLIDHALDGLHATIFAYGQTGAGKTYTMEGFDYLGGGGNSDASQHRLRPVLSTAKHKHGVIPRAIEALFDRAHQRMSHNPRVKYKIKCSYFQIYNEKVTDLLNTSWKKDKTDKGGLRIRWNKNNTFYVENLFIFECDSANQVRELFTNGVKCKAMGSHQMNLQSSRSHAIFTMYIESWDPQAPECVIKSELTLVDLAGSEKLTLMSKNPSQKLLQESIEINASLLALGKVISALGASSKQHVPYRDAKLTKLLKHALGGNSLTLMVACINPCDAYVEETVSTLFYAGRARNIRNDPRVNEDSKTSLIRALRAEIQSLKMELSHFRTLAMNNNSGISKPATEIDDRPHTAESSGDQSREVVFLGEKLVDSVKMLKDIIIVNGQLREAFDEIGRSKQEAEGSLTNLNEENVLLRERIEMLESIVMQEAEDERPQKTKQKESARPLETGLTSSTGRAQAAPVVHKDPPRKPAVGKKLEKYRSRYKQHKMPSYDDYYSVAATSKRTSRPEMKRQGNHQTRAFEGLKVNQQEPLFTKRADLGGHNIQSAAAMALDFSQARGAQPRSSGVFSSGNGGMAHSSPTAEVQQALSSGDSDLEARRRARAQRAALLEVQHKQLQQRHVSATGATSFAHPQPLMPQVPIVPQMQMPHVRQTPLSTTKTQMRRATEPVHMPGKKDKKKKQEAEPEPLKPDDAEYDKESLKVKIATYEMKIIRLHKETIELRGKAGKLQEEIEENTSQSLAMFKRLTKRLEDREKEIARLRSEAAVTEEERNKVETELRGMLNGEKEEKELERERLRQEVAELQQKLDEVAQFRQQKDSMTKKMQLLDEEVAQLAITHGKEIEGLQEEHKEERDNLRADMIRKWRKTRLEVYKLTEDHLQTKTQQTIQENEKLTRDLDIYAREAKEMMKHNTKLKEENTAIKRSLEIEKRSVAELMKKSQQQQRAIRSLVQKLRSYEDLYEKSQHQKDTDRAEGIAGLGETIDKQYDIIFELRKELDEANEELAQCQGKMQAGRKESAEKLLTLTEAQQFLLQCAEDVKVQASAARKGTSLVSLNSADRAEAIDYLLRRLDGFESSMYPRPPDGLQNKMKGSATALFNYIDSNKSGKISATEMARAMQEESIKNRLRWPGTSDQLVHLLSGGGSHVTESRLESYFEVLELFSFIDDNNSGRISPYELKRALQKDGVVLKKLGVPAHLSNTLFCQIDTNNSGAISFVEFYRHFTAAPLSKPFKALGNYSQITEALFKRMDKDNSGTITKDEFVDALRNDREIQLELGWPAQMANHLFTFLDSDRSGDVSRKEFALFCKAQWLFNTIDKNRSGYIDAYELGVALANPMLERELNSHASQAKQIFTRMDIDGSGMVKFSEFYRWMANPRGGYTSPAPPKIPENKCDHYKNVKRIGQGSFGDVWLVDHYSGERLIKKVPLLQESESGGSFRERMDEVRREAEMLKQYKHPNIVRYVDSYEEPVSKDRVGIIIITEFCSGGDLRGWMKNRKPVESEVVRLFSQICAAIQYLHHGRLLHRDLKPDNIFLSGKRETPTIKVGDFGLVKQLGKTQNAAATVCGTMPYMAPEILEGKTYGSENDVWALGCILYEMAKCDKRLAFPNIADTVNCNLPSGIPSWCAPTIRGILVANPKNRPSVDRLVTGLLKE